MNKQAGYRASAIVIFIASLSLFLASGPVTFPHTVRLGHLLAMGLVVIGFMYLIEADKN